MIPWLGGCEDQRVVFPPPHAHAHEATNPYMPKAPQPLAAAAPPIPGVLSLDGMLDIDEDYSFLGLGNDFDFSFEHY